ncbi:hypothetical protein [Pseudoxanthomonas sp. PXM02]|uniref:hypothetical protein n=1 Tax=Pseudoxanthomonas sp. PXM02 TaxID=2769294 RepID=UPI001785AF14|nr:hypothetical protein [Pseudoxanthomonas sp. PXM02]
MGIEDRIIQARGGGVIVGIRAVQGCTLEDAAGHFGLFPERAHYFEIDAAEAQAVLVAVLSRDMAYGINLVPPDEAQALAAAFVGQFAKESAGYYTNGDYGKPKTTSGVGPGWNPVTDATFDTGVLVVSPSRIACAWFMDED